MNTRAFLLLAASALLLLGADTHPALAADSQEGRLVGILVWGTNGDKPAQEDYKPIEPALSKRLARIFKWKNYFEISRKTFAVGASSPTRVEMSKDCRLEVTRIRGNEFEIQLYGKGVLVVTKRQPIMPDETVVLGGDDKNDDAWFVVLSHAKR